MAAATGQQLARDESFGAPKASGARTPRRAQTGRPSEAATVSGSAVSAAAAPYEALEFAICNLCVCVIYPPLATKVSPNRARCGQLAPATLSPVSVAIGDQSERARLEPAAT